MTDLLPCPFCGSVRVDGCFVRDGWSVGCLECSAGVTAFHPGAHAKAADKWNTRVHTDEIERLRSGIKRLSEEEELCAETTGEDPFSMVYLAAKLNDVEKQLEALAKRHEKALVAASMMRGALQTISSPTQTENLLWWQIEAREALSPEASDPRPSTVTGAA